MLTIFCHHYVCAGGSCPTTVELCEGQSCPADMQCVRSGPTAPSVCQCQPERLDECAGNFSFYKQHYYVNGS